MKNVYIETIKVCLAAHDFTDCEGDMFQYPTIPPSTSHLYAGFACVACYRIKFTVAGFTGTGEPISLLAGWLAPANAFGRPSYQPISRGFSFYLLNLSKALLQNR